MEFLCDRRIYRQNQTFASKGGGQGGSGQNGSKADVVVMKNR